MLRNALLLVALCVAALGFVLAAWPVAIWGAVLSVLILAERWRYQHTHQTDGDDWVATDEQFVDPETGKPMQVFYRASSGERKYVEIQ